MFKFLFDKIKLLWNIRKSIIKLGASFILKFLNKYENFIKYLLYIFLFILNIIFICMLCIKFTILKLIIYFIWILLTFFILDIYVDLLKDLVSVKDNDNRFIVYSILFFWMNLSCAFFFYDQILHDFFYDAWFLLESYIKKEK